MNRINNKIILNYLHSVALIKDEHIFVKIKLIHSHFKNKLVYKTKIKITIFLQIHF